MQDKRVAAAGLTVYRTATLEEKLACNPAGRELAAIIMGCPKNVQNQFC